MVINYLTIHVEIAVEEEQPYYIRNFFMKRKWTLASKAPINSQSLLSAPTISVESLLLCICEEPLVICRDFNIHVDCEDDVDLVAFCDLLLSVCLRQHVNQFNILVGILLISLLRAFQILLSRTSLMLMTLYLITPV